MECTRGMKICRFLGHFIGYLIILCILNFFLSILPYYIQFAVHKLTASQFKIDNFNLYVIGYTLFLVVISHFVPIIKKQEHILWSIFGISLAILFVLATIFLGLEYHDYITNKRNYSKNLRHLSYLMANIFIFVNVFLTFCIVVLQSISYSLSKMKKV